MNVGTFESLWLSLIRNDYCTLDILFLSGTPSTMHTFIAINFVIVPSDK